MMEQNKKRPRRASVADVTVDPYLSDLFDKTDRGKTVVRLAGDQTIFAQGEAADAVYFIQDGRVKLSVVSPAGREAVLAMLCPRGLFGEGCLVGQTSRVNTATTERPSTLFRIERLAMREALRAQSALSERFIAALLARNIDLEEDLRDQLINHSEKRLARVLLKLARFGQPDTIPEAKIAPISHDTLAEMVGTTRSRVTHLMNKFRRLGLIDYNGVITVRAELLTDIVLHD